ncbi:agmatine/peptidylarginine deiminase [Streptomyces sp. NPDC056883]|uniref:agmatine deiminase family protein n=1 Tax=Streptomyces sp. NPDC056883 TaxID=3345959 RepID=UPI0036B6FDA9
MSNAPEGSGSAPAGLRMPAESAPHAATWMAYGATVSAWGDDTTSPFGRDLSNSRTIARQDLMRLAANLSRFEPVFMLVDSDADKAQATGYLEAIVAQTSAKDQFHDTVDGSGRIHLGEGKSPANLPPIRKHPITFVVQHINDLWTRDTAPVFALDADGRLHGVDLNFNCWGQSPLTTGLPGWTKDPEKTKNGVIDQPIDGDRHVAEAVNRYVRAPGVKTWLTMEGGGLEVNGRGLGIACESNIVNDNRNPGKTRAEIEAELRRLFGVEKMLWLPGVKGEELTDWHIDFTARFTSPSDLLFAFDTNFEPEDQRNQKALAAAVSQINALSADEKARYLGSATATLKTHELPVPDQKKVFTAFAARNTPSITERGLEEFILTSAAGYVGYYEANGCVIMAQCGDVDLDRQAYKTVQGLYPDRTVIQITSDGIASGGGTMHCATQQQPSA